MVFLQRPPPRKPPTSSPSDNHGEEQSPQRSATESAMALPPAPFPLFPTASAAASFSTDPSLLPSFIACFSAYVRPSLNHRRVMTAEQGSESLIRTLLLVGPVQLQLQLQRLLQLSSIKLVRARRKFKINHRIPPSITHPKAMQKDNERDGC